VHAHKLCAWLASPRPGSLSCACLSACSPACHSCRRCHASAAGSPARCQSRDNGDVASGSRHVRRGRGAAAARGRVHGGGQDGGAPHDDDDLQCRSCSIGREAFWPAGRAPASKAPARLAGGRAAPSWTKMARPCDRRARGSRSAMENPFNWAHSAPTSNGTNE
jgi:hypothetical protein